MINAMGTCFLVVSLGGKKLQYSCAYYDGLDTGNQITPVF